MRWQILPTKYILWQPLSQSAFDNTSMHPLIYYGLAELKWEKGDRELEDNDASQCTYNIN